jgi:hypothetical protein
MKRVLIALAISVAAAACGHEVDEGHVVQKKYDDPDTWTTSEPVYTTQCMPQIVTRSRYVAGYGNNPGRTETYTTTENQCRQVVLYYQSVRHHDGPHWELRIKDDHSKHRQWKEVTQQDYDNFAIGNHWPDPR